MNVSRILKAKAPHAKADEKRMQELQFQMLKSQQALWGLRKKVVVLLEGFDAAGKGTCIRYLTQGLDPRGIMVIPTRAPSDEEKSQHYLQRFWKNLPQEGQLVVFDRSWYGRVLVEKIEGFTSKGRVEEAYREINQFEEILQNDGVKIIKIFLAVSKDEQLKRFRARMEDPLKQWKITEDDIRNRSHWGEYVKASDKMIQKCAGWNVIRSDDKDYARQRVLETVIEAMEDIRRSHKPAVDKKRIKKLARMLK